MDSNQIKKLFLKQGFLDSSQTLLESPISIGIYKAQVKTGNIGGMEFLNTHYEDKLKNTEYKSAFVGIYPYYPFEDELKSSLKISIYAKKQDYHKILKEKLDSIIVKLQKEYPIDRFTHAIDSKPVLERDLAFKAGLGWIGKNTCLINKTHGSLFFIAEILSTLSLLDEKKMTQSDHCGTCTRCIDACPTDALSPHKLDVEKCISYRSIEKKDITNSVLDAPLDSWIFGCDICQTVCPWNEKAHTKDEMRGLEEWSLNEESIEEIKFILTSSNKSLDKKYADFPLSRARGKKIKRNILQLIHENKIKSLKPFLETLEMNELNQLKIAVLKEL